MYEIYLDFAKDYDITLPPYVKSYDVIMYDKSVSGDIFITDLNAKYRIRGNSSFAILSVMDAYPCIFDEVDAKISIQQTLDEFMAFMQTDVVSDINVAQSIDEEKISYMYKMLSRSALTQSLTGLCKKEVFGGSSTISLSADVSPMIVTGVSSTTSIGFAQTLTKLFVKIHEAIKNSAELSAKVDDLKLSHVALSPLAMQVNASGATIAAVTYGDAVSWMELDIELSETKLSLLRESSSIGFDADIYEVMRELVSMQSSISIEADLAYVAIGYLATERLSLALDTECAMLAGHWQRVSEMDNRSLNAFDGTSLSDIDYVFS